MPLEFHTDHDELQKNIPPGDEGKTDRHLHMNHYFVFTWIKQEMCELSIFFYGHEYFVPKLKKNLLYTQ